MKKLIAIPALIALASINPAIAADNSSKHEAIGAGSGAVIGAIAGGPAGFVIGMTLGTVFGNHINKAQAVEDLDTELSWTRTELGDARGELVTLRTQVADLSTELAEMNDVDARDMLAAAISDGLELEVLYSTAASDLPVAASQRIGELATLLGSIESLKIELDGYADPRGEKLYNDRLSDQRARTVKDALVTGGIDPERITTFAHGALESQANDGDLDAYAFERRVSIRFVTEDSSGDVTAVANRD